MAQEESTGTSAKEQQQEYDWSAHYDDEGQLYYYNSKTEESSWEAPPEGFAPPPDDEEPPAKKQKVGETSMDNVEDVSNKAASASAKQHYDWSAHYDEEEGRLYYYNEKTQESAWEAPAEGFNPPPEEEPPTVVDKKQANDHETMTAAEDDEIKEAAAAEAAAEVRHSRDGKKKDEVARGDDEVDDEDANEKAAAITAAEPQRTEIPSEEDDHGDDNGGKKRESRYDWSAHFDDEGRLYYYNEKTEESSWEAPAEGFNPPEDQNAKADEAQEATVELQPTEQNKEKGKATADDTINKDATAESSATVAAKRYDWSAHYDDEGRLYYYNEKTEESAWEAPEGGFNPPKEDVDDKRKSQSGEAAVGDVITKPDDETAWIAYHDEEGRQYYYNQESGETSWDKPENYVVAAADEDERAVVVNDDYDAAAAVTKKSPTAMDVDEKYDDQGDAEMKDATLLKQQEEKVEAGPPQEEKEKEIMIDPAVKRFQDAEAALNKPDSVLEPSCMANVTTVVASTGGNPAKAIASLIENYHGQTAVCGLLARWLTDLNTAKQEKDRSTKKEAQKALPDLKDDSDNATADKIREAAQNVINKMAKERFTKDAGDSILDLSKSEAAFLEEMMDSPRWRKLLIDLSATQKDSAVLLYCLGAISKRGHHREIAKRINQSDHFAVFNAMLLSELAVIGGQAVSSGADVAAATSLNEVIVDLRQACSTRSYTYLYSVELLRQLERMARAEVAAAVEESSSKHNAVDGQERFRRAIRKWEALSEDLQSSMIDPSANLSAAGSFRKRRLDVALTISDLYQGQQRCRRRRIERNGGGPPGEAEEHENGGNEGLETGLLELLQRHSVGTQLEDAILDQLLPSGLDMDTRGVGELLIQHTLAIRALLGHLYKPGPTRITSPSTKNKCARLVALASIAAEAFAKEEVAYLKRESQPETSAEEEAPDEVALTRMIVEGSRLCEQLETVISFLVTSNSDKPGQASANPGQKLCSLALKCAPVGLGVMMWARELTHGTEFATSASFATLSMSVLSLVRLVAMQHPFTRADALQVALAFLRHSNPDISYQKVNAIKECSLRLLLFLLIKGDVVPVFASITARLVQPGSSDLDASLVRYFVAGVLEVVQPPVSPVFVRMFGRLLKAPIAFDAVRSTYFAETNRKRLAALLKTFNDVRLYDGSQLSREDASLVSSLLSVYQIE